MHVNQWWECNHCLIFCCPDSIVSLDDQKNSECVMAAGCNNREYLELAKKGGGHQGNWWVVQHAYIIVGHHILWICLISFKNKDMFVTNGLMFFKGK